jgi:hypothetical protein
VHHITTTTKTAHFVTGCRSSKNRQDIQMNNFKKKIFQKNNGTLSFAKDEYFGEVNTVWYKQL